MDRFDNVIIAIKMETLLSIARSARSTGEPGVSYVQWLDAWLYPHYNIQWNQPGISLYSDEGGFLYSGRFIDLPLSAFAADHANTMSSMSPQFRQFVSTLASDLERNLKTRITPSMQPVEVFKQVQSLFQSYRSQLGF